MSSGRAGRADMAAQEGSLSCEAALILPPSCLLILSHLASPLLQIGLNVREQSEMAQGVMPRLGWHGREGQHSPMGLSSSRHLRTILMAPAGAEGLCKMRQRLNHWFLYFQFWNPTQHRRVNREESASGRLFLQTRSHCFS